LQKLQISKGDPMTTGIVEHFRVGSAPPDLGPLVVFVNPKSGGNQGAHVIDEFRRLLDPSQVFNLAEGGPKPGLEAWARNGRFLPCRVLACGGDGTPGWVLTAMDELGYANEPPVAVLPLGTGNDISRVLGWGPGYKGQPLEEILEGVYSAQVVPFDRWTCRIGNAAPRPLNNYFSLGVDTDILLRFHMAREKNPEKFNNRERNKMHYIKFSLAEFKDDVKGRNSPLPTCCVVEADGKPLALPQEALGLMVLNIHSYGGGAAMWGKPAGFRPQSFSDKLLEVGYVKGTMHMAEIQGGVTHAVPLVQCSHLRIVVREDMAMQIDGEPWLQPCGSVDTVVEIAHHRQSQMMQLAVSRIR
jgi:diacylglycerol kinase (ATP)